MCYHDCTDTLNNKYHVQNEFLCFTECAETPAKYYIKDQYTCYLVCKNSTTHKYYNNNTVLCMR